MVMKIDDMPAAYWAVERLADKLAGSPAFRDMGILEQAPTNAARALAVGVLVGRVLGRIDDPMQDRNYRIAPLLSRTRRSCGRPSVRATCKPWTTFPTFCRTTARSSPLWMPMTAMNKTAIHHKSLDMQTRLFLVSPLGNYR